MLRPQVSQLPASVFAIARRRRGRHAFIHPFVWSGAQRLGVQSRVAALTVRDFSMKAIVLPPLLFTGLLIGLWTWKCLMMIAFQNKIIYIPYMPPNARSETISDYASACRGVVWKEHRTRASDGTDLALCVASVSSNTVTCHGQKETQTEVPVYILHFHGNASSLPLRLPHLSAVLREIQSQNRQELALPNVRYSLVCLSYRGYWTSRGKPSEEGIARDTIASLEWISQLHRTAYLSENDLANSKPALVVLWGASIGCGFATALAANRQVCPSNLAIRLLCLETPFTSVRDMLAALYPEKWVPYKHLWPFLWNHLDSYKHLKTIAERYNGGDAPCPHIFILQAEKDEIVPAEHGDRLYARCLEVGLPVSRQIVTGALHNDATWQAQGRRALAASVARVGVDEFNKDVSPPKFGNLANV